MTPLQLSTLNANTQAINQILAQAESINDQALQSPVVPTSHVVVQNGTNPPEKLTLQNIADLGSSNPAGSEGDVQLNIGGVLGANSDINYDTISDTLNVSTNANFTSITNGTPYVTEDFESGDLTGFTTDGNAVWVVDSVDVDQGVYSARSGVITGNQNSNLYYTATATGVHNTISFRFKVSSELNGDFFKFYIDGQLVDKLSGEIAWGTASYYIPIGIHDFRWEYQKDFGTVAGDDLVRIDTINLQETTIGLQSSSINLFENTTIFQGYTYFNDPINGTLKTIGDIVVNGQTFGTGGGNIETNLVSGGFSGLAMTNTIGQNTLNGFYAAPLLTTGQENTVNGVNSAADIEGGSSNTFSGTNAGRGIVNGNYNTITGARPYGLALTDQSNLVLLTDGQGQIAFKRNQSNEHTLPLQTNATITSGGPKSIINKEYADANYLTNNPELIFVSAKEDLPTPITGVITLTDNYTYFFTKEVDLLSDRLQGGQNTVICGASPEVSIIKSTGLGATALFTTAYTVTFKDISLTADLVLDIDGLGNSADLDWRYLNFVDCLDIGTVKDVDNLIIQNMAILNSKGLKIDGSLGTFAIGNSILSGDGIAGNIIDILSSATITRRFRIIYSSFVVTGSTVGVNVDASATVGNSSYILDTLNFSGGGTYLSGVDEASNKSKFLNCIGIENTSVNGQLYMQGNATATVIAVSNTFYKVLGTTTASADNKKYTHTNNRLTNDSAEENKYLIQCSLSFNTSNNNLCEFGFYDSKLAAIRTPSRVTSTASGTGSAENVTFSCVVQHAIGDYIEIHCANKTAANNITVTEMNFLITKI